MGRFAIATLLIALSALTTRPARAAACCVAASAVDVGRLLPWEKLALGFQTTVSGRIGHWNDSGDWAADSSDYTSVLWRSELWGHARIVDTFTFVGRLPFLLTHLSATSSESTGGGLADVRLGFRYEPIVPGQIESVPGIALSLGVTLPTGRTFDDVDDVVDVTARGGAALAGSLSVEYVHVPWFVRGSVGVTVPLPHESGSVADKRYGTGVTGALITGWELATNLVISALGSVSWEDDWKRDGVDVPDSAKLETSLGLALSWRANYNWTYQASVTTGLFFDDAGENQIGYVRGTLGIRWGYY